MLNYLVEENEMLDIDNKEKENQTFEAASSWLRRNLDQNTSTGFDKDSSLTRSSNEQDLEPKEEFALRTELLKDLGPLSSLKKSSDTWANPFDRNIWSTNWTGGSDCSLQNQRPLDATNVISTEMTLKEAIESGDSSETKELGKNTIEFRNPSREEFSLGLHLDKPNESMSINSYRPSAQLMLPNCDLETYSRVFQANQIGRGLSLSSTYPQLPCTGPNPFLGSDGTTYFPPPGSFSQSAPAPLGIIRQAPLPLQLKPNGELYGRCNDHSERQSKLYCSTCKTAVCSICCLHSIGSHFSDDLGPKRHNPSEGMKLVQNIKKINLLIKKICVKLNEMRISNPFEVCNEKGHIVFNTSLKSLESKPAVTEMLVVMNDLIEASDNATNQEELAVSVGLAESAFDTIEEFKRREVIRNRISVSAPDGPCPANCMIVGQGLSETLVAHETCFYMLARTETGVACKFGTFPCDVSAYFQSAKNKQVAIKMNSHWMNGVHKISFAYSTAGLYKIVVRVNSMDVPQSPFYVYLKEESKFSPCMVPRITVGDEKSFNRPWGVCSDSEGNFFVSDRCNNSIKVLDADNQFKLSFGESGSEIGQLKKPSGIAIDRTGNVVVCDKDNHRIQVFSRAGKVLRSSDLGSDFTFPWAVAIDSSNRYVVTHSKSKISLLSAELKEILKVDLKNEYGAPLSPRGVCIGYLDEILITEFETGKVYTVNPFTGICALAFDTNRGEPQISGYQKRLQGIYMDSDGYLLIADSKNSAVEVYTYSGSLVSTWYVDGKPLFVCALDNDRYIVTLEGGKSSSVLIYARGTEEDKKKLTTHDFGRVRTKRFQATTESFKQRGGLGRSFPHRGTQNHRHNASNSGYQGSRNKMLG